MPPIPSLLRFPERLIHPLLHLDDARRAMRFHLAAVHQGVRGADPSGGGEAPEVGRDVGRRVPHEDHIQHLVAEIQHELAEVAVAVDGGVDVAAAAVPGD